MTVEDVDTVYRTALLGPSEQNDLVHYETRLKEGLEDDRYAIAMEILAEAATRERFTPSARRCLEQLYAPVVGDTPGLVADILEVLVHDGYLEDGDDGFRFPSRLLKDWWSARFRDHYIPSRSVGGGHDRGGFDERRTRSADPQVQSGHVPVR